MPELPSTITEGQKFQVVMDRVAASVATSTGLRTDVDSNVYKILSPSVIEINNLYREAQRVLEMTSVQGVPGHRAAGEWLDQFVVQMSSLTRIPATRAVVGVRFSGSPSALVPAGYEVVSPGSPAVRFSVNAGITITAGGLGDGFVTALQAGSQGNVPPNSITQMTTPLAGVNQVTNLLGPTIPGLDTESDESLIRRFLDFMRDQPNGSNPAQYETWAREVPGVGNARALRPGEVDGPPGSRVDIYIVDTNMLPASQTLVDQVLRYISPPREATGQAETFTIFNNNGITLDTSQIDDSGSSYRMDAGTPAAEGQLRFSVTPVVVQGGIWTARPRIKVSSTVKSDPLFVVDIWNVTTNSLASTLQTGGVPATTTWRANQLSLSFIELIQQFTHNGTDTVEVRLRRDNDDTTTILWLDQVKFQSLFSSWDLRGKANATAIVQVLPAIGVTIDVAVSVKLAENAVQEDVVNNITASVEAYLREIALRDDEVGGNDVLYGEVGKRVQDAIGVQFYDPATLKVNNGTANITISKRQVAVRGSISVAIIP